MSEDPEETRQEAQQEKGRIAGRKNQLHEFPVWSQPYHNQDISFFPNRKFWTYQGLATLLVLIQSIHRMITL